MIRSNWLETIRQSWPVLLRLSRHLEPTWRLSDVAELDPMFFEAHGIRGIIWDVDGTLMGPRETAVAPPLEAPFRQLRRSEGLRHVILSNCGETRYRQLGELFPDVPVIRGYMSPVGPVCRRLWRGDERWRPVPSSRSPERLKLLRKPSPILIEFAVRELNDLPRSAVALVGDQYFTDVAPANLAGIRSIKVDRVGRRHFSRPVRVLQKLEALVYGLSRICG